MVEQVGQFSCAGRGVEVGIDGGTADGRIECAPDSHHHDRGIEVAKYPGPLCFSNPLLLGMGELGEVLGETEFLLVVGVGIGDDAGQRPQVFGVLVEQCQVGGEEGAQPGRVAGLAVEFGGHEFHSDTHDFGDHLADQIILALKGHCCVDGSRVRQGGLMRRRPVPAPVSRSAFAGFRFPPEAITVAVRWYLRYGLSYRDVEELLAERGIEVDHVTVYRWVQRFTPLFIDVAQPCRHTAGDRWFVDETYVKVSGRWIYLYRAVDQFGQVIDVLASEKRDLAATRRFFARALGHAGRPAEVTTDRAPAYPRVLDELLPAAHHVTEQYANNPIESDHGRLKSRLRPMRGLKRLSSARVISTGHGFVQNLSRGHYELGVDVDPRHRIAAAFTEFTHGI